MPMPTFTPPLPPPQLLTPSTLNSLLPHITLLDVRGRVVKHARQNDLQPVSYVADREAFNRSRLPNASFIDWRTLDLKDPQALCEQFRHAGVCNDKAVCVYDWGDMLFAARLWLALAAVNKEAMLLNGGWEMWRRFGGRVEEGVARERVGDLRDVKGVSRLHVGLEEMKEIVAEGRNVVVDVRSAEMFAGDVRRGKRGGRILGARNLPYRRLLRGDGVGFRDWAEIKGVLKEEGLKGDGLREEIVTYCSGGVSSCVVGLAVVGVGGRFRNYCGSWNEWGGRDDTMIEGG